MIVRLQSTVSTMIEAAALAINGAPHGTAVVAEEQTGGIGRHGHTWHSEPGTGLYLSIVLRIPAAAPILTMALGLAVQRSIDDIAGVTTDIRWPNDVMLNEKKLAGIMIQSAHPNSGALIAGIGVNVNQSQFPEDLREIATSLKLETGRPYSREDLLNRIVPEALRYAALGNRKVLNRFERHSSWARGKSVEIDGKLKGVTQGLDENGFLLLATPQGTERVLAGGLRPATYPRLTEPRLTEPRPRGSGCYKNS